MTKHKTTQPAFVFDAYGIQHVVPGAVWGKLVKQSQKYSIDPFRVMYRIVKARPRKIVPFIASAMRDGWCWEPCRDEIENPRKVNDWCARFSSHDWIKERTNHERSIK